MLRDFKKHIVILSLQSDDVLKGGSPVLVIGGTEGLHTHGGGCFYVARTVVHEQRFLWQ